MRNRAIGLDIGSATIKSVWLSKESNGYGLVAVSSAPTPPSGMLSDSPVDQETMMQTIKKLIADTKITAKYVNIALPETQVYTKVIEMPILSDKELSSAIFWEAEQYIPVPLENLTLDYKVLRRIPNSIKMQVLLVGAPTAFVLKYKKIIEGAGLIIDCVETEVLSILRSLVSEKSPPTLVLNIGSLNSSLCIVKDGVIIFTYSVAIGGAAITRAIATEFSFSPQQAEEYKKTYGIIPKNLEGKISKASEPVLQSILTEVKKAIAFYNERYKSEGPLTQIVLSGGTAKLPGINLYFAKNCEIESVIANPWKVLANQEVPKVILDNAPDYSLSVGLAMRGL